jgi:hypothetical protein
LYETRGQQDGQALEDWFKAESEVLEKSILAPLYRRLRTGNHDVPESDPAQEFVGQDSAPCESNA